MARSRGPAPGHLPRWARTRRRAGASAAAAPGVQWRFRRAVDRVAPDVDRILADHATGYWQRGVARREVGLRVEWVIDGEVVLELRFHERGPSELVVHDFSLFVPLRRTIRTRHVHTRFATARDVCA